jgi:iron complex outermembrane receptor protein
VRVPTRFERDIAIDVQQVAPGVVARLLGSRDFEAEKLIALEAGYRWTPAAALSADVAAFHNDYDDLASLEIGDAFPDQVRNLTIVPVRNENLTSGHTRGVEAAITYSPTPVSRFSATYAHLDMDLEAAGADLNRGVLMEEATPRHQFGLRSSFDLPARFQVDGHFRHVSVIRRIPSDLAGGGIPGYAELNVRVAWLGWRDAEISLIGRNLLHARHLEFGPPDARGEIERAIYARVAWGF